MIGHAMVSWIFEELEAADNYNHDRWPQDHNPDYYDYHDPRDCHWEQPYNDADPDNYTSVYMCCDYDMNGTYACNPDEPIYRIPQNPKTPKPQNPVKFSKSTEIMNSVKKCHVC